MTMWNMVVMDSQADAHSILKKLVTGTSLGAFQMQEEKLGNCVRARIWTHICLLYSAAVFIILPELFQDYHPRGRSTVFIKLQSSIFLLLVRTSSSSRIRNHVIVSASGGRFVEENPFSFEWWIKQNSLVIKVPFQAASGRKFIEDLLDMGIASLLTERHGTFD